MTPQDNALIELLGDHHRASRRKSKLTRRILLQRTGRKGRRSFLPAFTALYLLHGKFLLCQIIRQCLRLCLAVQGEFLAVCMGHLGDKGVLILFQLRLDCPVLLGLKGLDLALTIADQAYCDRLDTSGRKPLAHLAPEER